MPFLSRTELSRQSSVNMAWKDLAQQLQNDLKKRDENIALLQRQLAESEEKSAALYHGEGHPSTGHVQQVLNLQNELQVLRAERNKLASDNASLNETLQNTLIKLHNTEPETCKDLEKLEQKIGDLGRKLAEAETQHSLHQTQSSREEGLQVKVSKLSVDLNTAKGEAAKLSKMNESLQRQLQVEKTENASRIGFMRSDPSKCYDQDDEEDLPIEDAQLKKDSEIAAALASMTPPKKFKTIKIPDELKASALKAKKAEKVPAPKKRKRSEQEELENELADLDMGGLVGFQPPAEPRRKRVNATYVGREDSMDSNLPDTINVSKPKAKATAKKRTTEPLTPVSPEASSFSLTSDDGFTFKAVCTYEKDGSVDGSYGSADLKDMAGLCDRIAIVTDTWERYAGEAWQYEFERRSYNSTMPVCITKKLQKQRTTWHKGFEGMHACKDCVQSGKPCFTYFELGRKGGWDYAEFRLLPLHESDRKKKVSTGKEIRWWVNDQVKLVDFDEMDEGEDWD